MQSASTNITTFPGKVGISNANPTHTLDIGSNVYVDDAADTKLRVYGNIHASSLTVDGNITVIETDNLSVKDPVLLLASGSTGTSDTGIIMKRADGDSNVTIFYDEGVGLNVGHTLSRGDEIHLSIDTANALTTNVYGPVNVVNSGTQALSVDGGAQVDGNLQVGAVSNLFVNTTTSNVGIGTTSPAYRLDVNGKVGIQDELNVDGGAQVDGNFQVGVVSNLFVNTATSNVGIGTTTPAYKLEVDGKVGIQDELKVTYDADTASYFGRAAVGYMGQSDQASFSHLDKNTSTDFALKQAASGATHLNTPTGQHIRFSVNASEVGRFTGGGDFKVGANKLYVDSSASEVQMYSQATGGTAGPDLVLMRDNGSGVGANNQYIGQIRYEGRNDTGGSLLYAKTTGKIKTASNGSEDGVIETMIKTGGSNRISVRHSGAKFLIQKGTDLQVGEVANLYVDTSTSRVGINVASPSYTLDVDGDLNLSTGSTLRINGTPAVFSNWTVGGSDIYRSSGNIGIGTNAPFGKLQVNVSNASASTATWDATKVVFGNITNTNSQGLGFGVTTDSHASIISLAPAVAWRGLGYYSAWHKWYIDDVEKMTLDASGNVGIGTTTPQEKFHLYGSPIIQHETRYGVGANQGWYKIGTWNAASATGARLKISLLGSESYSAQYSARGGETIIYASVNNNIPTTTSNMSGSIHAHGNPVITEAKFKQVGTDRTQYEIIAYVSTYTRHTMKIECSETTTFTYAWTSASDPGADSTTVQAALFTHVVDNSGNVGIGTAAPDDKLHIYGDDNQLRFQSQRSDKPEINFGWSGTDAENFTMWDFHSNHRAFLYGRKYTASTTLNGLAGWHFYANGSTALRIDSDGYVGIGTTSPQGALHVAGSSGSSNTSKALGVHMGVYSSAFAHIEIVCSGSNTGWIDFKNANTTGNGDHTDRIRGGDGNLTFITDVVERMRINPSGNVGIGTNDPTHRLHIGPKDNDHIYLASSNNSYGWKLDTDDQGAGEVPFRIRARSNNVDTTCVTIRNQDGKVGIGATGPTELLHIAPRTTSESAFIRIQSGSGGSPATESGIKLTESGPYGFQLVHMSLTDLLKVKHQDSNGNVDKDNIMIWHPNGDVQWGKTARYNLHYNPNQWSYATNTYNTATNFWSVSYYFDHDGYVHVTSHGHWSRKDANNSGHVGGNQAFYGWISLNNKEPADSSLYDQFSGATSSYQKFHEYWSPDATGAGSWRDFNYAAVYKVSAGWNTFSLRVQQFFGSSHYLNINGSGLNAFYIPKHYL